MKHQIIRPQAGDVSLLVESGQRVVILFEGRDAAGKAVVYRIAKSAFVLFQAALLASYTLQSRLLMPNRQSGKPPHHRASSSGEASAARPS